MDSGAAVVDSGSKRKSPRKYVELKIQQKPLKPRFHPDPPQRDASETTRPEATEFGLHRGCPLEGLGPYLEGGWGVVGGLEAVGAKGNGSDD